MTRRLRVTRGAAGGLLAGARGGVGEGRAGHHPSGRALRNTELKALQTLGLDEHATPDTVKTQYKTLVKRLHPDANGGSRANEDTLKSVIQAYDHLRESGFV